MVELLEEEIKKVLYYAYKTDVSFPRSCGLVSMLMSYLIATNEYILEEFDVYYVRGCYKNVGSEDEWCDEYIEDISRDNYEKYDCNCQNCGCCDAMISHSWIELYHKTSKEIIILDFTSIQFDDDICDYDEEIIHSNFTIDELYDYIKKRSLFMLTKKHFKFERYIPLSSKENAINYIEHTKNCIFENCSNQIIDFLIYFK